MNLADLPRADYDAFTRQCPFGRLKAAQEETPVLALESTEAAKNLLLITDPDDILAIARKPQIYGSFGHPQSMRFNSDATPEAAAVYHAHDTSLKPIMVWSDGADHSRVRKLVQHAFSIERVREKAPYVAGFVSDLIDGFAAGGEVDLMSAYAMHLPAMVITREFGLEQSDVPLIQDVTNAVSATVDLFSPTSQAAISAETIVKLHDLLNARLADPASLPQNCMLSDFLNARVDGEAVLSRAELMWLATILLAAGSHTTAAMIGWLGFCLAERQDLQARLRAEPELVPAFVEEVLRLHEPVPTTYRIVKQDTELRGLHLPAGTNLIIRWDNVNMDARKFPEPETLDPDRANVAEHSTFGVGRHFCIGNQLARRELTLTAEGLLARFSGIEFAQDSRTLPLVDSFDVHMLAGLPLKLTPA